jgi:hypothetical protein
LIENRFVSRVDAPVIAVFNELLAAAKSLAPEAPVLRAIARPSGIVKPATLLMLVDQILVALDGS